MSAPDQAPAIATFWVETPLQALAGGEPLSFDGILTEALLRFPTATAAEFKRGAEIASAVVSADRAELVHADAHAYPCTCGQPGFVIVIDEVGQPTGERFCVDCAPDEIDPLDDGGDA